MKRTHNAFVRVLALMLAVVLTAGMCTIGVNAATLNVGSNDVMNYAYYRAYLAGNDNNESELSQRIAQALAEAGSMGEAIQKLLDSAKSATIFDPSGTTTRAQIAAMINRFDQLKK